MKQILVEIDDHTAEELERVAPARSRQRSEFIRQALRQALWARAESATRAAYLATPDEQQVYVESGAWEPKPSRPRRTQR
jgi:predicted transcriptional regulator